MSVADRRDFFVSFNQADRGWATWVAWVLEDAGYSVFFQDWDFRGNFVEHMNRAHAQAHRTLAVLSDHYLGSEFTLAEWSARFAQDPPAARTGSSRPRSARSPTTASWAPGLCRPHRLRRERGARAPAGPGQEGARRLLPRQARRPARLSGRAEPPGAGKARLSRPCERSPAGPTDGCAQRACRRLQARRRLTRNHLLLRGRRRSVVVLAALFLGPQGRGSPPRTARPPAATSPAAPSPSPPAPRGHALTRTSRCRRPPGAAGRRMPCPRGFALGDRVEATCSAATGGDISGSTVSIVCGIAARAARGPGPRPRPSRWRTWPSRRRS